VPDPGSAHLARPASLCALSFGVVRLAIASLATVVAPVGGSRSKLAVQSNSPIDLDVMYLFFNNIDREFNPKTIASRS